MPLARHCPDCGNHVVPEAHSIGRCVGCNRAVFANSRPTAGVLIEREGKLLLIRRGAAPAQGAWDVPGGFLDEGEQPEHGARREIREELGLELGVLELFMVDVNRVGDDIALDVVFRATTVFGEPKPASDAADCAWFPVDELPQDLAFPTTERALLRHRSLHVHDCYRVAGGVIVPNALNLRREMGPSWDGWPAEFAVKSGAWRIHDGLLCGTSDGGVPAILRIPGEIEGDWMVRFQAFSLADAGSGFGYRWTNATGGTSEFEGDATQAIFGGDQGRLVALERPATGLFGASSRSFLPEGRRMCEIAAGQRGHAMFCHIDGDLAVELSDPSGPARSRKQIELVVWHGHVHFRRGSVYQLPDALPNR